MDDLHSTLPCYVGSLVMLLITMSELFSQLINIHKLSYIHVHIIFCNPYTLVNLNLHQACYYTCKCANSQNRSLAYVYPPSICKI